MSVLAYDRSLTDPPRVTCELLGCRLRSYVYVPVDGRLQRRCLYHCGLFAWDDTCKRCGIRDGSDCDLCGGKGFVLLPHQAPVLHDDPPGLEAQAPTPAGPVSPPETGRQDQTRRCGDADLPESVAAPDIQTKGTQNASTIDHRLGVPGRAGRGVAADPVPPRDPAGRGDEVGRGDPGLPAAAPPRRGRVSPTDAWLELGCWVVFFCVVTIIAAWLADRR